MRCKIGAISHRPVHETLCAQVAAEINALEARGFYQETYKALKDRFHDWDEGVWSHRWHLVKNAPCALCNSREGPAISAGSTQICLRCLNEYPNVPWHPTGLIRAKVTTFLSHAANCSEHSS